METTASSWSTTGSGAQVFLKLLKLLKLRKSSLKIFKRLFKVNVLAAEARDSRTPRDRKTRFARAGSGLGHFPCRLRSKPCDSGAVGRLGQMSPKKSLERAP